MDLEGRIDGTVGIEPHEPVGHGQEFVPLHDHRPQILALARIQPHRTPQRLSEGGVERAIGIEANSHDPVVDRAATRVPERADDHHPAVALEAGCTRRAGRKSIGKRGGIGESRIQRARIAQAEYAGTRHAVDGRKIAHGVDSDWPHRASVERKPRDR